MGSSCLTSAKAFYVSLAFNPTSSAPYIAFNDETSSPPWACTVLMFDGSSWTTVGSVGFSGAAGAKLQSLAFQPNSSLPYVAYEDGGEFVDFMYATDYPV